MSNNEMAHAHSAAWWCYVYTRLLLRLTPLVALTIRTAVDSHLNNYHLFTNWESE